MKNQELAKIFYEMAVFLEMDEIPFKPYAYEKAAFSLESLKEDIGEIYRKGGSKALMEIPGIGKNMAEHIEEYLKNGKIKIYEQFKKKMPVKMEDLLKIEGLGPKKIKVLYRELSVKNLSDLEKAAKAGRIAPLFGFGEKTEKNILQGLDFAKKDRGRFLLGEIMPTVNEIYDKLKNFKDVEKINLAGSLRRKKETIGDVDFLVISKKPERVMDFFVGLPGIERVWGKGGTKTSVRMKNGFDIDIRVVPQKSYGAALQYFTGSKDHNIAVRAIAMKNGLKLSEYGLFGGEKMIAGETEEEIYEALGMKWISPEIRENTGEIEASVRGNLPELIKLEDIKGDLHCHSNWNGGKHSIEEMAETAKIMGYGYIGISDHTNDLKIEKGLSESQLLSQREEIKKINKKFNISDTRFKILHGCEANIRNDGSIDVKDEVLSQLDYVIAGVHSQLKMPKAQMMERIERAMKNPNVDIISHPTGRLLNRRDEYQHDFDKILKIANETKTILEINSSPHRLDLRDSYIRRAKKEGVKMIINTDSHQKEQLNSMEYGVSQARRGWAEREDILNTLSAEKLLKYLD